MLDKQLNLSVMVLKQPRASSTMALSPEEGFCQSVPGSRAGSENWWDHQVAKTHYQIPNVICHQPLPLTQIH